MTRRPLLAAALGSALMATALSGATLAQDEAVLYPAEGVEWQLQQYVSDGAMLDVPMDVQVTLFMSGGDVVGTAGCNSYFGSYVIDATTLTFPTPFGSTQMACEGAAQEVEAAYLPLLSAVAGWTIDDQRMLRLSDAEGTETLVYREPAVEITATDIENLSMQLASLQAGIDQAEQDIAALNAATESTSVKLRNRVKANEEAIAEINKTIDKLRERIKANEEAIAEINTTIGKFRNRINKLEATAEDHEARITALEEQVPAAVQPLP